MKSFVRISALLWADIFVDFALFVMQDYLTKVWQLSFTHAAGILNFWGGISNVLPAFFLFLVDAFMGNFMMLVLSSIAYSVGIGFVAMSTPPVLAASTNTCSHFDPECIGHTQKALFYTGMVLISVGIAGHLVSVKPFLEEQRDGGGGNGGGMGLLQLFAFILVVIVALAGAIVLPYIKPWSIRFGIPAIITLFATLLFLTGCCMYEKADPTGSPIASIFRVFIASSTKICKPFPRDANDLHKGDNPKRESFMRTRYLRCLEKAAIILPDDEKNTKWRLTSVGEVEEAKIAVRMIPMWLTFIICGIVSSTGNTYFVEQASNMTRKVGKWKVPPQVLLLIFGAAKSAFARLVDKYLANSRKRYSSSIGIAVAMIFSILCCMAAAGVETRRLNVIRKHDLLDKPDDEIPMTIFWLVFQFILLAGVDSSLETSVARFYNDQAPESMTKYLEYFTKCISGFGFMCGVLSVYVVGRVSERGGRPNWFQKTLNRSHLDRYYWVLAALSSVNLVVFIVVGFTYSYKTRKEQEEEATAAGEPAFASNDNGDDDEGGDGGCIPCCC